MKKNQPSETLTVLYDGDCPLCQREIAHVRGLAQRHSDSKLCFVDVSGVEETEANFGADRATLLARFHVQRADGSSLDGAQAFVAMWSRLPGWRWLARLSRLPGDARADGTGIPGLSATTTNTAETGPALGCAKGRALSSGCL